MSEKMGEAINPDEPSVANTEQDFRSEQAAKVTGFLRRVHAYDYVKSIVSGEEALPSFEDFEKFIVRLNGIARDIPISKRKPDGENVRLSGLLGDSMVPRPEDKRDILKYAFDSIKDIDKKDVKYMLPAVINAVHLFADGNGRTSRIMHVLLSEHASEEECLAEVEKSSGLYGRLESFDANPVLANTFLAVLKNHGWIEESEEGKFGFGFRLASVEIRGAKQDTPQEAEEFFKLYRDNGHFALAAIEMVYGKEGVKKFFTDKYGKNKPLETVSPLKMLETLKSYDWQVLVNNYYQLKKEEAMALVDIFKDPDKYGPLNGKKTMRENFIEAVNKKGQFI